MTVPNEVDDPVDGPAGGQGGKKTVLDVPPSVRSVNRGDMGRNALFFYALLSQSEEIFSTLLGLLDFGCRIRVQRDGENEWSELGRKDELRFRFFEIRCDRAIEFCNLPSAAQEWRIELRIEALQGLEKGRFIVFWQGAITPMTGLGRTPFKEVAEPLGMFLGLNGGLVMAYELPTRACLMFTLGLMRGDGDNNASVALQELGANKLVATEDGGFGWRFLTCIGSADIFEAAGYRLDKERERQRSISRAARRRRHMWLAVACMAAIAIMAALSKILK